MDLGGPDSNDFGFEPVPMVSAMSLWGAADDGIDSIIQPEVHPDLYAAASGVVALTRRAHGGRGSNGAGAGAGAGAGDSGRGDIGSGDSGSGEQGSHSRESLAEVLSFSSKQTLRDLTRLAQLLFVPLPVEFQVADPSLESVHRRMEAMVTKPDFAQYFETGVSESGALRWCPSCREVRVGALRSSRRSACVLGGEGGGGLRCHGAGV